MGLNTPRLLLNGRFLARPLSGVDRTASEITLALAQIAATRRIELAIAVPRGAPDDEAIRRRLVLPPLVPILRSRLAGYAWEQLVLPFVRPDWTMLSLCNMGPIARANQFVLVHDMQVRDVPESYSRAFRLTYRLLQPLLVRRARIVASVSHHSRERILAHGLGGGRPIEIIASGADHMTRIEADEHILARHGLSPEGYLLGLAQAAPHKNIAMLVRACRNLGVPLVLAGPARPADFGECDGGSLPHCRFIGRVTDEQLKALYRHARLFLLPSRTEGFGLPLIEAMACGCPVLASRAGALPEVGGDAAHYCEADDEAGWTAKIAELQSDPATLAEMAMCGAARAKALTWHRAAQQVLSLVCAAAGTAAELHTVQEGLVQERHDGDALGRPVGH